jgi:hypothetical protein
MLFARTYDKGEVHEVSRWEVAFHRAEGANPHPCNTGVNSPRPERPQTANWSGVSPTPRARPRRGGDHAMPAREAGTASAVPLPPSPEPDDGAGR